MTTQPRQALLTAPGVARKSRWIGEWRPEDAYLRPSPADWPTSDAAGPQ